MRLSTALAALVVCLGIGSAAHATSILIDDSNSFTLASPNVVDQVVLIDTAHFSLEGGTVNGNLTLLDGTVAELHSGSIGGSLRTFDDSLAVIFIEPGTGLVDGGSVPDGTILGLLDCPTCTVAGHLVDTTPFSLSGAILAAGHIQLQTVEVPEPNTFALLSLGLFGLVLCGNRRFVL